MSKVLTDYAARVAISPAALKRFGDTTRHQTPVLASVLNALGLANAREMTTGCIKITLRGSGETIAGITRILNFPPRLAMAFAQMEDAKSPRSVAVVSEDIEYIDAAFGRGCRNFPRVEL